MLDMNRRSLIKGIGLLVAAPAIVRVGSLMPVKATVPDQAIHLLGDTCIRTYGASVRLPPSEIGRFITIFNDGPSPISVFGSGEAFQQNGMARYICTGLEWYRLPA